MTTDQPGRKGSGTVMPLILADPGAGLQAVYVVPQGCRMRVMAFYYELQPDGTVIDRFMGYQIRQAVIKPVSLIYHGNPVTAGVFTVMSIMAGAWADPLVGVPNYLVLPAPEVYLDFGMVVETLVLNMQAGDVITNPTILIERWAI